MMLASTTKQNLKQKKNKKTQEEQRKGKMSEMEKPRESM
jgi:hypothetical protein